MTNILHTSPLKNPKYTAIVPCYSCKSNSRSILNDLTTCLVQIVKQNVVMKKHCIVCSLCCGAFRTQKRSVYQPERNRVGISTKKKRKVINLQTVDDDNPRDPNYAFAPRLYTRFNIYVLRRYILNILQYYTNCHTEIEQENS